MRRGGFGPNERAELSARTLLVSHEAAELSSRLEHGGDVVEAVLLAIALNTQMVEVTDRLTRIVEQLEMAA